MRTFHQFKASSRRLIVGAVFVSGLVSSQADEPKSNSKDKEKAKVTAPAQTDNSKAANTSPENKKKVIVTGSYIPRKVRDYRSVGEAFSPTYVIDQEQIQQSGAATTAGVLRKTIPFSR